MINILEMFFLQFKRRWLGQEQEKKFPLVVIMMLLVFVNLQIGWLANGENFNTSPVGWTVAGIFVLYTIFGLFSNQLPGRMEDVMWLYTAPYPLSKVVYASLVWRIAWKGSLWLISAILGDVMYFSLKHQFANLTGRAFGLWFVLAALEAWIVAVSCARTVQKTKLVFVFLSVAFSACYGLSLYYSWIRPQGSEFWSAVGDWIGGMGAMIRPSLSPAGWIASGVVGLVALVLIRFTADKLECKEKLVKEADFWAEFQAHHAFPLEGGRGDRPSWWGLKSLTGVFSFLWFELLLAKKNRLWHVVHILVILILFPYLIAHYPVLFGILFGLIVLSHFMSSYFSGLVRHAKSGDLFLLPGRLWEKALLLEIANTLWLFFMFLYSVWLCRLDRVLDPEDVPFVIACGAGAYIFMLAIRWVSFVLTYSEDPGIPVPAYYKNLVFSCGGSVFLMATLYSLLANGPPYVLPLLMVAGGSVLWMIFYRYRKQKYLLYIYFGTSALSFALITVIRGIG